MRTVLVLFLKVKFKHLIFNKVPMFTQRVTIKKKNHHHHIALWSFQHRTRTDLIRVARRLAPSAPRTAETQ